MIRETLDELVRSLSLDPQVRAVGLSSDPLPLRREDGDLDLFVYCDEVPDAKDRALRYPAALREDPAFRSRVFVSGFWGDADYAEMGGIETWIMYFRARDALLDFNAIAEGSRPSRVDGCFYPTGRLAMFKNMRVLYDADSFLLGLQTRLAAYPPLLKEAAIRDSLDELEDEEDLLRASGRGDVVFFHAAVDAAVDAFLRLLYAANDTLFPSRKRVEERIAAFPLKPRDCHARILAVFRLGCDAATLAAAFAEFRSLKEELLALIGKGKAALD
ncbi:MAG: DUF4037 domain-containing protein [Spirochaetaceae bacterium]|nr:DUF4037 domain-containing protein [Spirochaetaceae bacterium]